MVSDPILLAEPRMPQSGRYRVCDLVTRMNALVVTATVHVAVFGLAIYGWQQANGGAAPRKAPTVITVPPSRDEPKRLPKPGRVPPKKAPEPTIVEVHPAPLPAIAPLAPVLADPPPAPAAPLGGSEEALAQTTQAYRQALMARLERERAYPRKLLAAGQDGLGMIAFRIDRGGQLIDTTVEGSTGNAALDRAAVAIVRRAAPFPPIPLQLPDELTITLPVSFLIVRPGGDAQVIAR